MTTTKKAIAAARITLPAPANCIAFEGHRKIAVGPIAEVASKTKPIIDRGERAPILIFDATTSRPIEIDFRGPLAAILKRLKPLNVPPSSVVSDMESSAADEPERRGPGRPKLGVIAREITLLPRHWDWLSAQPGGASVALRRLVEQARKQNRAADQKREAQESAYRFMSAIAGNLPGYEEALRALFAGNPAALRKTIQRWPKDIQQHILHLANRALTFED